jgi:hypothetical protein
MYHPTLSSAVTRRIWGSPDAILLFFAGGAAEFAAIKAVDWLFFTGRLPDAPIERLFETVWFAQRVFLGVPNRATKTIEEINRIHRHLEGARGQEIPQWAYRDVLFILIDYGERAHEVVYGPMSEEERICHLDAKGYSEVLRGVELLCNVRNTAFERCITPVSRVSCGSRNS